MEAMREAWTDRRLVDERFDKVDTRFDRFERRMDDRFNRLEARFDVYQRATLQMSAVVIAAMIGFIATQI